MVVPLVKSPLAPAAPVLLLIEKDADPAEVVHAPLPNVSLAADPVLAVALAPLKLEEKMGLQSTGAMNSTAFTTKASSAVVTLKTVSSLTLNPCLLMKPFVSSLVFVTLI